jgi:hypothetical protein
MDTLKECSREQKIAILSSLQMISQGSENQSKLDAQEKMIRSILIDFDVSETDWENYIDNLNPQTFQKTLKSLSAVENEFYLTYIFELLNQNGKPTSREETVAKNACLNISGISNEKFDQTMNKLNKLGSFFS